MYLLYVSGLKLINLIITILSFSIYFSFVLNELLGVHILKIFLKDKINDYYSLLYFLLFLNYIIREGKIVKESY